MSRINKAILIGRVGKDPETRYMSNGEAVTNLTLATSETWKDKSGEKKESTEWHNLTFYRKLAEIAGEYVKKGSMIYVEGKIQTRKWQDKEGKDRYTTEIVVHEMQMLGGKSESKEDKKDDFQKEVKKQGLDKDKSFSDFDSDVPFAPHGKCGSGVSWRSM